MKAPDEVYVFCDWNGNPDKVDIFPIGKNSASYVNKGMLLDWAKKMIADDKNRGIKGGFYKLIDKLNSL